jgi:membrane protein implicated in regulation of membrane protease activity
VTDWLAHAGVAWLMAAALLAGLELLVPGIFLIFVALAAAITGVIVFALPDFPFALQWVAFAAWTAVSVGVGKRWYRDYPVETSDPLLNDRTARLIGQEVVVTQAIVDGRGRVRVGDGEWPAHGPDTASGVRVRIIGGQSAVLEVEPVDGG